MFVASSLKIAFLRSFREETTLVAYRLERSQCFVMNASSKTIDIMLSSNMSKSHIVISDSSDNDASFSIDRNYRDEESSKTSRTARSRKIANYYMIFQDIRTQRQTMIYSIFRQRLEFDRANNIDALNDRIARYERTTSSYEKLSYRLKIFKKHQSMTSLERVIKLIKTNDFLLQKLAYYKDISAVEMRFLKKVIKLRANIEDVLTDFDRALEERSKTRANAKFILLNYWDIDLKNENIEDSIF